MDAAPIADLVGLAVALGCGLLLGIEREQHRADQPERSAAGVRTLALVALTGALASMLGNVALIVAGTGIVLLLTAVAYLRTARREPGMTTEISVLLSFLLGALALSRPALAAAGAVLSAILLQAKGQLHLLAREVLSERDLNDALLLLACVLIVLPLLPDQAMGPENALNPRRLWMLVVLVLSINAAGYVASRLLGARYGLPLTGFAAGFVSSSATHASMGQRARQAPVMLRAAVAGALASNIATYLLMLVILFSLAPALAEAILPACVAGGSVALSWAGWMAWRTVREGDGHEMPLGRPFHFRHALAFAALIAGVLLLSAFAHRWFGASGITIAAAAVGFADAHAAVISIGEFSKSAVLLRPETAVLAILLALSTNTITKAVVSYSAGGLAFAGQIWPALALMLAATWAGALPVLL